MHMAGKLIGVGVGPGDPELITSKAVRALEEADVVAHFAKAGNGRNARTDRRRVISNPASTNCRSVTRSRRSSAGEATLLRVVSRLLRRRRARRRRISR